MVIPIVHYYLIPNGFAVQAEDGVEFVRARSLGFEILKGYVIEVYPAVVYVDPIGLSAFCYEPCENKIRASLTDFYGRLWTEKEFATYIRHEEGHLVYFSNLPLRDRLDLELYKRSRKLQEGFADFYAWCTFQIEGKTACFYELKKRLLNAKTSLDPRLRTEYEGFQLLCELQNITGDVKQTLQKAATFKTDQEFLNHLRSC